MEKFSLYEALEQAVQTERLGNLFYTAAAEQFSGNKGVAELFRTLASKEQKHEQFFLELKEKMGDVDVENWDDVSMYLRAIVESEFFLGKERSLSAIRNSSDIADAIRSAIGFEKETLLYFYAIRDAIGKHDIMDRIIAEERSHVLWLRDFERTIG